jgi:hypothetical protein
LPNLAETVLLCANLVQMTILQLENSNRWPVRYETNNLLPGNRSSIEKQHVMIIDVLFLFSIRFIGSIT